MEDEKDEQANAWHVPWRQKITPSKSQHTLDMQWPLTIQKYACSNHSSVVTET